jgi:protein subunit release factor A
MNKEKAMQMLKAKLLLLREQENREKLDDIRARSRTMPGEARSALMYCSRTR